MLYLDDDLLTPLDSFELLENEPLKPSQQVVEKANNILANLLKREPTPVRTNYKKFDPLNQKLSSNFNQPEFANPVELVEKIDLYFQEVEHADPNKRIEPSTASLALHLNMSRKMLNAWEEKPVYGPIISAAKTRIESYLSSRLIDGRPNTGGVALVLKNDFDWREKQELSGELTFSVTRQMFTDPINAHTIKGEIENA
jgi:hypothetical protein